MAFTGKATYSGGSGLPELAEDVSDIVGIVSPYETPLLDALGDPTRAAAGTVHEWLEDALLPNSDRINDSSFTEPDADTTFVVEHADRFRVGDQVQVAGSQEVMLVTGVVIGTNTLTVVRAYGGTVAENLADDQELRILGNAALEGDSSPEARFTNRERRQNTTQIFTSTVEVSGTMLAARRVAVSDEMDYQKQERLRELARDLENCVINGVSAGSTPEGSGTVRRTMRGIIPHLSTNVFTAGVAGFEAGETINSVDHHLTESQLNSAMRSIWESSSGSVDLIVVGGAQKRRINGFVTSSRGYTADDTRFRDLVGVYESDFGVCRVVLSRWVPADTALLLDSSRIDVLPLSGRSFHYKPLAATGDREAGQLIGEYTLELRNEQAHGLIRGLAA
ncbi:SU10 major capsid protein [Mucisphaera sp.]|uniref:SU10 major capsid protein n=1 Tax=Mucisphaera sp. TaxID=2913024 RepID=UPI003D13FED0